MLDERLLKWLTELRKTKEEKTREKQEWKEAKYAEEF